MRIIIILTAVALVGCTMPGGTASTPVSTQGAQTVGAGQGQVGETGSATNNVNPNIYAWFLFGKTRLTQTTDPDTGEPIITVETDGGAEFNGNPVFQAPYVTYGESSEQKAEVSSGGGGAAGTEGTTTGGGR